jgi:plasmid maintenance system antidote protein VapI
LIPCQAAIRRAFPRLAAGAAAIGSRAETWLRMQMEHDLAQARTRKVSIEIKRLTPRLSGP